MEFSTIWQQLPVELTEQIFTHVVDSYFHRDPAYTWVHLRQLSGHQKRTIERRFRKFWLPRLSITLYKSAHRKFDYGIDMEDPGEGDIVTFAVERQIRNPLPGISQESVPSTMVQDDLYKAWNRYNPATMRNITVRLGEGYLSKGLRGGYVLNDTDLPGLQLKFDVKWKIQFRWKEAMNELLREEMYMRRVGGQMFAEQCAKWCDNPINSEDVIKDEGSGRLPPLRIQVRLWKYLVQCGRRVAGLKHRVAKSQGTSCPLQLSFAASSADLHRQPVSHLQDNTRFLTPIDRLVVRHVPDIFEVVADREESVVPHLDVFQRWLAQQTETTAAEVRSRVLDIVTGPPTDEINPGGVSLRTIYDLYGDELAWVAPKDFWSEAEEGTAALKERMEEEYQYSKAAFRGFDKHAASQWASQWVLADHRRRWQPNDSGGDNSE